VGTGGQRASIGGGWAPNTPASTIKRDVLNVLEVYKEKHHSEYKLATFSVSEGFGEHCRFKIENETTSKKDAAWNVTSWFSKAKLETQYNASPSLNGQPGGALWFVVHKPKEKRVEGGCINTGLRALHLAREQAGHADNFYAIENQEKIQMVKGKFIGETKGCRWLGDIVAVLKEDAVDDAEEHLVWDWAALARSKVPLSRQLVEEKYKEAVQEKKNARNRR
jgi:hypothetical protein